MRDPKVTTKIMKSVKSKDTKIEVSFGKALWARGLRYRKHYKVIGKPDFALVKYRVAIFVDGDFWHGHGWKERGFNCLEDSIKRNKKYWIPKINRNKERDKFVDKSLRTQGWIVLRFWESKIKKNIDVCVEKVLSRIDNLL